ncbi:hypothetical protein GCM10011586_05270 [Silvibacterium dinghuense]|nr:hypothetical protein GCM10011586_05270 [Silvibacterium dinghuense]
MILAILGTLLRLALIAGTLHHERFFDEEDYHTIGLHLSQGMGFKDGLYAVTMHDGKPVVVDKTYFTAYRAPGQPVLVALVYGVLAHTPPILTQHLPVVLRSNPAVFVEIVEALLLAVLPFVCARLGLALGLSPLAANLAAALAAFHPALAYASITLYPTVLTTTALTLGVWYSWQCIEQNRISRAVAAGVALGIAGAATTTFAPAAFLAAVILVLKKRMRMAIIVLAIGLAPALAWMMRNQRMLGDFTLATNGGYNLELGANDRATPRSGNWVELPQDWAKGEVYLDHADRKQAADWIHVHRSRYAELVVLRALAVFDSIGKPKSEGLHSSRLARLVGYALLPVMILGAFGLILYGRHPLAWLTAAALGLVILSSAATIAKPRFRFPCDPLLGVFAVGSVAKIMQGRLLASSEEHPSSATSM